MTKPRYRVKFDGYRDDEMVWALLFGGVAVGQLVMSERMARKVSKLLNAAEDK